VTLHSKRVELSEVHGVDLGNEVARAHTDERISVGVHIVLKRNTDALEELKDTAAVRRGGRSEFRGVLISIIIIMLIVKVVVIVIVLGLRLGHFAGQADTFGGATCFGFRRVAVGVFVFVLFVLSVEVDLLGDELGKTNLPLPPSKVY
jgi:hypothetical protein